MKKLIIPKCFIIFAIVMAIVLLTNCYQNEKDLNHYTFAFGYPFFNLGIGIEYSLNSISLYSGLKLSDRASSDYSTGFLQSLYFSRVTSRSWMEN